MPFTWFYCAFTKMMTHTLKPCADFLRNSFSWLLAPFTTEPFPCLQFKPLQRFGRCSSGDFCTMLAFLQTLCQKFVPPGTASLIMSLEAVFGVFLLGLSWAKSYPYAWLSVLVFVAILLSQKITTKDLKLSW